MFPVNVVVDDCEEVFRNPFIGMEISFDRLSTNGTAVFQIDCPTKGHFDSENTCAEFFEEAGEWGIRVLMGDRSVDVMDITRFDPVNMEVLIPWKDLYSAFADETEQDIA